VKLTVLLLFSITHCSFLRLTVQSGLDVPNFATRRLHACHHARALSRWDCGREISGHFAGLWARNFRAFCGTVGEKFPGILRDCGREISGHFAGPVGEKCPDILPKCRLPRNI
jgi:hypothetical protein